MSIATLVAEVLDGTRDPSALPPGMWSLWADGFRAGAERVGRALAAAAAAADYWYLRANHTPEEIEAFQQKAISDAFRELWDADVATYEALTAQELGEGSDV